MIQARDHVLGAKIQVGPEHHARLGLQKCRIAGIDIMGAGEAGQGTQSDQSKAAQRLAQTSATGGASRVGGLIIRDDNTVLKAAG